MSKDDVLFGYRLRLFALAGEIGVRPACRAMGVHHSTYYRWAEKVERWGLEALRPRERRRPRMPNQLGPHLEQRIVADGPVVLVGHSYGGGVITEAGTHERVTALVYVAGFMPDAGESVNTLLAGFPTDGPQPPILPPVQGFLFLDREKFHESFAGDLPAQQAAFLADAQVPWGVDALGGTITEAAWKSKRSWYLLTTEDRMIPPDAQRTMSGRAGSTVVEVNASHAVYVSQPGAVADLVKQAATATAAD